MRIPVIKKSHQKKQRNWNRLYDIGSTHVFFTLFMIDKPGIIGVLDTNQIDELEADIFVKSPKSFINFSRSFTAPKFPRISS